MSSHGGNKLDDDTSHHSEHLIKLVVVGALFIFWIISTHYRWRQKSNRREKQCVFCYKNFHRNISTKPLSAMEARLLPLVVPERFELLETFTDFKEMQTPENICDACTVYFRSYISMIIQWNRFIEIQSRKAEE